MEEVQIVSVEGAELCRAVYAESGNGIEFDLGRPVAQAGDGVTLEITGLEPGGKWTPHHGGEVMMSSQQASGLHARNPDGVRLRLAEVHSGPYRLEWS
jgi:hypothetical protein